jgi:hypothetical protein
MIDLVIEQRRRDFGGFEVGRVLPFAQRQMSGPVSGRALSTLTAPVAAWEKANSTCCS